MTIIELSDHFGVLPARRGRVSNDNPIHRPPRHPSERSAIAGACLNGVSERASPSRTPLPEPEAIAITRPTSRPAIQHRVALLGERVVGLCDIVPASRAHRRPGAHRTLAVGAGRTRPGCRQRLAARHWRMVAASSSASNSTCTAITSAPPPLPGAVASSKAGRPGLIGDRRPRPPTSSTWGLLYSEQTA